MKLFSLKKALIFTVVAIMALMPLGVVFGEEAVEEEEELIYAWFAGASVTVDGDQLWVDLVDGLNGELDLSGLADDAFITDLCVNITTSAIKIGYLVEKEGASEGEVEISDAIYLLRYLVELEELDEEGLLAADTNGDGKVDIADAIAVLRYIVELIEEFNAAVLEVTEIGDLDLGDYDFDTKQALVDGANCFVVSDLLGDADEDEDRVSIATLKDLLDDGDVVTGTLRGVEVTLTIKF